MLQNVSFDPVGRKWWRRDMVKLLSLTVIGVGACGQSLQKLVFRPEDYGAKGDGRTNDTLAFSALADAVNRAGGGTIQLRNTVYILGMQQAQAGGKSGFFLEPARIFEFVDCRNDVVIQGGGATLKLAAGLRYGLFDRRSGEPVHHPLPYYKLDERATPAAAMISATGCRGAVRISELFLDGNIDNLILGGKWGDKGWQIGCSGIFLKENHGAELVENVTCRNFPLDGIILDGLKSATKAERRLVGVVADRNGRQGCSVVGGHDYVFERCRFTRTGRGPITSEPGAGVDIEPESGKLVSSLRFTQCTFGDNAGPGMLAATPDSSDVFFASCTFIGTTNWAAWPAAPRYGFDSCTFVGASTNCFGDTSAVQATRFVDCLFRDTQMTARAPGADQLVFLGSEESGPIVDVSSSANVRFTRCRFQLTGNGLLPWSTQAIYENCTMYQRSLKVGYPRGRWLGRSMVQGKVDLGSSKIMGMVSLNGQPM